MVSLYELEFKRRRNQARGFRDELDRLPTDVAAVLPALGVSIAALTPDQAVLAGRLPMSHGDPWDRILIAQARDLGVPLVSADRDLLDQAADTPVIW